MSLSIVEHLCNVKGCCLLEILCGSLSLCQHIDSLFLCLDHDSLMRNYLSRALLSLANDSFGIYLGFIENALTVELDLLSLFKFVGHIETHVVDEFSHALAVDDFFV